MRSSLISTVVCTALVGVLTGCGGSSGSSNNGGGGGGNNNPQIVSLTFNGGTPTAAAVQIGTGSFSAATISSNALSVSVPSGTTTYSVAYVCPASNGFTSEFVIEASTQDGTAFTLNCYTQSTGSATGTADATAIPGAANILVYAGNVNSGSVGSTSGTFSFNLQSGTLDVAVVAVDGAVPANVLAVKILRNQTIPGAINGGTSIVFQSSDEITMEPIAVTGVPAGFVSPPYMTVYYLTANGTTFLLNNNNSPTQSPVLPAAAVASGDFYEFIGDSVDVATQHSTTSMGQNIAAGSLPSTVSLSLPASWSYSGPTPAQFPTLTFNYPGFSGAATTAFTASIGWQPTATTLDGISVSATAAFQNGSTTVAIPDLTSISGFVPAPASGTTVGWSSYISGGAAFPFSGAATSAGSFESVSNQGTYVEP